MTAADAPARPAERTTRFGGGRTLRAGRFAVLGLLGLLLLMMLLPFAIVAINAFKSPSEFANRGPIELPRAIYLDGISRFWQRVDFSRKLINSTLISASVAALGVLVSVLNGYALGIGRIPGRMALLATFLIANALPQEALVYPLYYLAKLAHLYDTQLSVIIILTVIRSAFGTYLLASVLGSFPREILEAAQIDGATRFQILTRIVVPNSRPVLAVLLTFFFIWTWNEFFLPLIFLVSNDNQTVPVALAVLQGQHQMDQVTTAGSALLGIVPAVVFFVLFQRTLTRGITAGALK